VNVARPSSNRWLIVSATLLALWIGFLLVVALRG
jgi:hypothetical protein